MPGAPVARMRVLPSLATAEAQYAPPSERVWKRSSAWLVMEKLIWISLHRGLEVIIIFYSVQSAVSSRIQTTEYRRTGLLTSELSLLAISNRFLLAFSFCGNRIELEIAKSDGQNCYNHCQLTVLHLQPMWAVQTGTAGECSRGEKS